MKKIALIVLLLLTSCAQLKQGQQQSVRAKNVKEGIYYTTCTGAVEDWGTCHDKAHATCNGNYSILERFETATAGVRRELTFQCKR